MHAELIALLDRERTEVERLKGVINRLHQHISKWSGDWHEVVEQRDSATRQVETLLLEVKRLSAVIELGALRALFGPRPAVEVYAAQNELELLRVIRKSQGEGITKLRKEKDELLKRIEHDATVIKRNRDEKVYLEQAVEMLQSDFNKERHAASRRLRVWREVYNQMKLQRDAWRQEVLNREVRLHSPVVVKPDCGCEFGVTVCPKCDGKYVVYSNPVEAMKANPRLAMMLDEDRRAYNRNVDNQKAYEAPNCPSS